MLGRRSRYDPLDLQEEYPLTFKDHTGSEAIELRQRRERAWQTAERAAQILKESLAAERVVVFGSLVDPHRFTKWSDIDIAAWGIPPDRYFHAVAAVCDMSPEFKIDLVDPEICRSSLRQAIEKEGVEL